MVEKVKVEKDGIRKQIQKKDLPLYISLGWKEVGKDTVLQTPKFSRV